jgi:hypothetical protein
MSANRQQTKSGETSRSLCADKAGKKTLTPEEVERAAVRELVKAARARGDDLTGPDGLLVRVGGQDEGQRRHWTR